MQDQSYQNLSADYESLNDESPTLQPGQPAQPIDWRTIGIMLPWGIKCLSWGIWLFFLLIPTAYGLHGTDLYPIESNVLFVMTGAVLAIASSSAFSIGHIVRSALFAGAVFILSYWF